MSQQIVWTKNTMPNTEDVYLSDMAVSHMEEALRFHRSFPMYRETPLHSLDHLAARLGIGEVHVKDESRRFGLNAFKALGASFAMAKQAATDAGVPIGEVDFTALASGPLKDVFDKTTFFTATDGNHGRGVAWAARQFGRKAVVFMPKGTRPSRLENIRREGATVTIEETNYDGCVRIAARAASDTPGGMLVQDTAWDGYEQIPRFIMQGYGTMVLEAVEQLGKRPTHVFVQAGVGTLAGAVQGAFAGLYPENPPTLVVVEADKAACHYVSALSGDGRMHTVGGELDTIMAGLACGEPNKVSFDILRNHASFFAACPDWVSALGMRVLGAPLAGDKRVISGESGAVGLGLLLGICIDANLASFRQALGLDGRSVVLLFSTEGATDPERYEQICWEGAYPAPKGTMG